MKALLSLVTLFAALATASAGVDTPESIDNPEALRKAVATLSGQKLWTSFASPKQIKLFEGKQNQWPMVPGSTYDPANFEPTALGSKVPPRGVHPRILFSPEDVPTLAKALKSTINGRKVLLETECVLSRTLFDPETDEGRIFDRLAAGDLKRLVWPDDEGKEPGLKNTHYFKGYKQQMVGSVHSGYLPRLLTSAAFVCLLNDDDARGKRVAAAIASYYASR